MAERKYLSGNEKRKLKEKRDTERSKFPKVTDFFQRKKEKAESRSSNVSDSVEMKEHATDIEMTRTSCSPPPATSESETSAPESTPNSGIICSDFDVYKDVARWPHQMNDEFISQCLVKESDFFQNYNSSGVYPESGVVYKNQKRNFSNRYFEKAMKNGQIIKRSWLCYSKSQGSVYCFVCKMFSTTISVFRTGFKDWVNIVRTLENHEESKDHKARIFKWLTRKENKSTIDRKVEEEVRKSINYYNLILKRIVAVLKFLCGRGLALRGHEEKWGSVHNGNFMGLIELLAQFDPFLEEHLNSCRLGEKKSYLSKTIFEEIIGIMAEQVIKTISEQVNKAKYFSIIVDSSPDMAHIDQLAIIVRYVFEGKPCERFLCFLPIEHHKSNYLFDAIEQHLLKLSLPLENIRGQSYDNAANMSGKYSGLQARFKSINNYADFIPCAAHSLNLVGVEAVSISSTMVNYFGIVQQLYVFFSASPHRWSILKKYGNLVYSLKTLSSTRWCAHYEAVRALKYGYSEIIATLATISSNEEEKPDFRKEAANLHKKLIEFEFGILTIIWEEILDRFNNVSSKLQANDLDIIERYNMLLSLASYVQNMRGKSDEFLDTIESKAKRLSPDIIQEYRDIARRKVIKKLSDGEQQAQIKLGKDRFRIEVVNCLLDSLQNELAKRCAPYKVIISRFKFLIDLSDTQKDSIDKESLSTILSYYHEDLEDSLHSECHQFKEYLKITTSGISGSVSCQNMLHLIYEKNIEDIFPNLTLALRIFLTLPVTSCEAERSFLKMAYIKNRYRATMHEKRFNSLSVLSIENDITSSLSFENCLKEFSEAKIGKSEIYLLPK